MNPPINKDHPAWDGETPPRGLWSHDYRPLPYQTDKGAYLPVEGKFGVCLLVLAPEDELMSNDTYL